MNLFEKLQAMMTAAAFTEEGDFRTALELFLEAKNEAKNGASKAAAERALPGVVSGNLAVHTGKSK